MWRHERQLDSTVLSDRDVREGVHWTYARGHALSTPSLRHRDRLYRICRPPIEHQWKETSAGLPASLPGGLRVAARRPQGQRGQGRRGRGSGGGAGAPAPRSPQRRPTMRTQRLGGSLAGLASDCVRWRLAVGCVRSVGAGEEGAPSCRGARRCALAWRAPPGPARMATRALTAAVARESTWSLEGIS